MLALLSAVVLLLLSIVINELHPNYIKNTVSTVKNIEKTWRNFFGIFILSI